MKVAELTAARQVTISEQVEPQRVDDDEVLVKITACGICGTDLHYFRNGRLGSHPIPLPLSLGHEPAGIIEEVSEGYGFKVGDRVSINPSAACGACSYCQQGLRNLCPNDRFMGSSGDLSSPGAFREYVVVRTTQLYKLEDWMPYEAGALLEPLGIALQAIQRAQVSLGDTVMIFGAGVIGLYSALLARLSGASVVIHDVLKYRVDFARNELGIEGYWTTDGAKIKERLKNVASVIIDAAGEEEVMDWALSAAAPAGRIVQIGMPEQDYERFNPHLLRIKELTILGVRRSNNLYGQCLDLVQRGFPIDAVVTHKFPLDDIQEAFEIAADYQDGIIKGIIVP